MSNPMTELSLRQAAIVTGVAILIMAVAAVVATDLTIGSLIEKNDAAATTTNIKTSEMLFRTGTISWVIILICDVVAAWGLFIFLKPVIQGVSLIMAWFRLVYAAILGTAILKLVDVLMLINRDGYVVSFGIDQFQSQILLSVNGFYQGWSVGLIVFGVHIFLLGYLIIRSAYIPKYWGILLIIASFGYLMMNLGELLFPDFENIKNIMGWIFILPMLSEVGLGFWLLMRGVKVTEELA